VPVNPIAFQVHGGRLTRVCIDSLQDGDFSGALYNACMPREIPFQGVAGLLRGMEQIMDLLTIPQSYELHRTFDGLDDAKPNAGKLRLEDAMGEQAAERKMGQKATFLVQVQFRQNATWQGTITWTEGKKVQHFRSTLELIKLMSDAVEPVDPSAPELGEWKEAPKK